MAPAFRRVQIYDLLFGIGVMIILNLAVWTLGAEVIHQRDVSINDLEGLASLLGQTMGQMGYRLFYVGVFAAVFTSMVGSAMVLAFIAADSWQLMRGEHRFAKTHYETSGVYRGIIVWGLVSPIIWTFPGMPDFVTLTLIGNSLQILLVPVLAGGLWWITARAEFIGSRYRNRWWENLVMALAFSLAVWGSISLVYSFVG